MHHLSCAGSENDVTDTANLVTGIRSAVMQ